MQRSQDVIVVARILVCCVLLFGAVKAEAAPITWLWEGPVVGYQCLFGPCPETGNLATVVPLGTSVKVSLSFDPLAQMTPGSPFTPCLWGNGTAKMEVLGQTYAGGAHIWDGAHGFGSGMCVAGYEFVEAVVPSWGAGGPPLPDGWIPFALGLDGLWWQGDLPNGIQPLAIAAQLPTFYKPGQAPPERLVASLRAVPADPVPVPEPGTLLLMSTGLAAAAARRAFRRS